MVTSSERFRGVLLLGFGGPDSLDAVEPFLKRVMGGRDPSPELVAEVTDRYKDFGGRSPLIGITQDQAMALQRKLDESRGDTRVYVGMGYWRPFIHDTVRKMSEDGIREAVAISLAPFYSRFSTGFYFKSTQDALAELEADMDITFAESLCGRQLFIEALAERVRDSLAELPAEMRSEAPIVFCAHSVPVKHIEMGDPYREQFESTAANVMSRVGEMEWMTAFQSKGYGRGAWLEPDVATVLRSLVERGYRGALVAPIGFVSDHMETLYDIDVVLKKDAESMGLFFKRVPALNTSPRFIEALASMVTGD